MLGLKLPREDKERMIDEVSRFFEVERGEEIGRLAAEQLLDAVMEAAAPYVYNQALADARKQLQERMRVLDDDLYAMELRPDRRKSR